MKGAHSRTTPKDSLILGLIAWAFFSYQHNRGSLEFTELQIAHKDLETMHIVLSCSSIIHHPKAKTKVDYGWLDGAFFQVTFYHEIPLTQLQSLH